MSRWMLAAVALLLSACPSSVTFFQCVEDSQCGASGRCEPNEYCSFPDEDCSSNRRYGNEAAPGIAGQCVPEGSGSSSSGPSTTVAATDTSTSSGSADVSSSDAPTSSSGAAMGTSGEGSSTGLFGTSSSGGSSSTTSGPCDDGNAQSCATCAAAEFCADVTSQCLGESGCMALVTCILPCQDQACEETCCEGVTTETAALFDQLFACIEPHCAVPGGLPTCS